MSKNEQTSARVAAIAGKYLHDPNPEIRMLAASCLTQAADKVMKEIEMEEKKVDEGNEE